MLILFPLLIFANSYSDPGQNPSINANDTCVATLDCFAYDIKLQAEITDTVNTEDGYWWKYVVYDAEIGDTIQYSFSYEPQPLSGRRGTEEEQDTALNNVRKAEFTLIDPLPEGTYTVIWTADDGVGNSINLSQTITVADKKAPTPLLEDIVFHQPVDGGIELKANWFDKGGCGEGCISSFDNCTLSEELYFTYTPMLPNLWIVPDRWNDYYNSHGFMTFNPETGAFVNDPAPNYPQYNTGNAHRWHPESRTSSKLFLCYPHYSSFLTVKVHVWDKFDLDQDCDDNNYSYSEVIFGLDCKPWHSHILGSLSMPISNMHIRALFEEGFFSALSDHGKYKIPVLPNKTYDVTALSDIDWLNGVTTLDQVLIQRHILGLKLIHDPHSLIAADVNESGTVTAADILDIRKLLLSITDRFANNSWIGLNPGYTFGSNPVKEASKARVRQVRVDDWDVHGIDFDVVKIGDVNGSVSFIEPRNSNSIRLLVDDIVMTADEEVAIPFFSDNFKGIYGGQFTMNISGLNLGGIADGAMFMNNTNYNVVNDELLVSFIDAAGIDADDETVLFTLIVKPDIDGKLSDVISLNNIFLSSEVYKGDDLIIYPLELVFRGTSGANSIYGNRGYALHQNEPNPFAEYTVIGFILPSASEYRISIFDATGRTVISTRGTGVEGYNSITVTGQDIDAKGVLYYRIESGDYTATRKMIAIN